MLWLKCIIDHYLNKSELVWYVWIIVALGCYCLTDLSSNLMQVSNNFISCWSFSNLFVGLWIKTFWNQFLPLLMILEYLSSICVLHASKVWATLIQNGRRYSRSYPIRGRSFMTSAFFWPFWTPRPPPLPHWALEVPSVVILNS